MTEILNLMPILAIAIAMNIGAGLYYNIGKQKFNFNWRTLISGIIKAIIVAGIFIGTAYCFDATDLSSIGVTPEFIMKAAIILYIGKAITSLARILGVDINTKLSKGLDYERHKRTIAN